MSQYRWITKVLVGPWLLTKKEALCNAVVHGQGYINPGKGEIVTLREYASIEQRKCAA